MLFERSAWQLSVPSASQRLVRAAWQQFACSDARSLACSARQLVFEQLDSCSLIWLGRGRLVQLASYSFDSLGRLSADCPLVWFSNVAVDHSFNVAAVHSLVLVVGCSTVVRPFSVVAALLCSFRSAAVRAFRWGAVPSLVQLGNCSFARSASELLAGTAWQLLCRVPRELFTCSPRWLLVRAGWQFVAQRAHQLFACSDWHWFARSTGKLFARPARPLFLVPGSGCQRSNCSDQQRFA